MRTHDPNLGKVPQVLAPRCEELRWTRINYGNNVIFSSFPSPNLTEGAPELALKS